MIGTILKLVTICMVIAGPDACSGDNSNFQNRNGNEAQMENNEAKSLPKLKFSVHLDGKRLEVNYKVKNELDRPIYLFSVRWEMSEKGAFPAEQQVYVNLLEDKTLLVAKKIPALPLLRSVEFREIPYVRRIEANAEYIEKFVLDVPVEEFNPYFPKTEESKTELQIAERVAFQVQFIRQSEELELKETAIENAFVAWHPDIFGNVETITANPSPVSVQVNKRLDEFGEI